MPRFAYNLDTGAKEMALPHRGWGGHPSGGIRGVSTSSEILGI